MGDAVTVQVTDGAIARVTIDVPRTRNALSTGVLKGLAAAIRRLSHRDDTRVIVLTGHGGTFSSGADLKENAAVPHATAAVTELYAAITESPKPVLARVEGRCLGLAVGVVAACDLAIVASDTSFGLPEPRLGQAPTLAALTIVPKLRGSDASELLLTGAMFDGSRASALGLANESVAASELDAAVDRWIDRLTSGAPGALAACKKLVLALRPSVGPEAMGMVTALAAQLAESDEAKEGHAAFFERRPPGWAVPVSGAANEY